MSNLTIEAKPSIVRIWTNGILAAIVAVLLNVILFFVGSALEAFPEDVLTPMGVPVDVVAVILNTTLGVLGGTLVYTILARFLQTGRANLIFIVIAILVLVAMGAAPFQIEDAATLQIVFLEVMHLVAGLSAVFFLSRSSSL